jgi:hypothetical protein
MLKLFLFAIFYFCTCFVLISGSRFRLGAEQALSYRYAYYYLIPYIIGANIVVLSFQSLRIKAIFNTLFIVFLIGVFPLFTYKAYENRKAVDSRNLHNIAEIRKCYSDSSYNPDLSQIHPYLPKEDIIYISRTLHVIKD